ncbi:MAG: 3D domain-containing protein [Candidatus Komeilibacteria bacterium]|nr:3D domain-containing protein [Candidatus Komeilibacteria bacterium]
MLTLEQFEHNPTRLSFTAIIAVAVLLWLFPQATLGDVYSNPDALIFDASAPHTASILSIARKSDTAYEPSKATTSIMVTSYNSEPGQTDATPFITAFGTQVRDGIVATNYLPKGTKVRFPDLYGDKVFVVEDRMNIRYYKRMDIWSADKEFSRNFGARYLRMEIL